MYTSMHNVVEIAKKEFACRVHSPTFFAFVFTFTLVIMAKSYVMGLHADYSLSVLYMPDIMEAFRGISRVVGIFVPVMGIVMGFDVMVKEISSSSLNVLLTHPVFRDTIILGKFLGALVCIFITLIISVNIATGVMFIVSGMPITMQYLLRIELFILISFLYSLTFVALSLFISTIADRSNISLLYSIAIWLFFTVLLAEMIQTSALIITDNLEITQAITLNYLKFTPGHHYAQLVAGLPDVVECIRAPSTIGGIFDTAHSLSAWLREFWSSLIYLIVTPVLFLIASFIAFLRKDITL